MKTHLLLASILALGQGNNASAAVAAAAAAASSSTAAAPHDTTVLPPKKRARVESPDSASASASQTAAAAGDSSAKMSPEVLSSIPVDKDGFSCAIGAAIETGDTSLLDQLFDRFNEGLDKNLYKINPPLTVTMHQYGKMAKLELGDILKAIVGKLQISYEIANYSLERYCVYLDYELQLPQDSQTLIKIARIIMQKGKADQGLQHSPLSSLIGCDWSIITPLSYQLLLALEPDINKSRKIFSYKLGQYRDGSFLDEAVEGLARYTQEGYEKPKDDRNPARTIKILTKIIAFLLYKGAHGFDNQGRTIDGKELVRITLPEGVEDDIFKRLNKLKIRALFGAL